MGQLFAMLYGTSCLDEAEYGWDKNDKAMLSQIERSLVTKIRLYRLSRRAWRRMSTANLEKLVTVSTALAAAHLVSMDDDALGSGLSDAQNDHRNHAIGALAFSILIGALAAELRRRKDEHPIDFLSDTEYRHGQSHRQQ